MQNPYSKIFLNIKFLFVNRLSKFLRHILGQGMLNHDKIITFMVKRENPPSKRPRKQSSYMTKCNFDLRELSLLISVVTLIISEKKYLHQIKSACWKLLTLSCLKPDEPCSCFSFLVKHFDGFCNFPFTRLVRKLLRHLHLS